MSALDGAAGLPAWDLGDLYKAPSDPALARDLDSAGREAEAFARRCEGKLGALLGNGAGGKPLAEAIAAYERISEILGRAGSYASLLFAADMSDAAVGKFRADVYDRINAITRPLVFFELEINSLGEAALARALEDPALKAYAPWVRRARRFKPHQLSDELEHFLHDQSVTGSSAWVRFFDEALSSLTFEARGERLSAEAALHRLMSPDASERAVWADALARCFGANARPFALILNTLIKDKEIEDRWRHYDAPESYRHLVNEVEPALVDALAKSLRAAYPKLTHRYYALKARWLAKDKLDYWDRSAPLPDAPVAEVSWIEARQTVLSAYRTFSPAMAEIAERFFDKRWIDAPLRPGKATGAFAHSTVPSVHPYVLLNYQGHPRDVMTLAHELGHGVHQTLAGARGYFLSQTPLTLAETASVFGEMLTFRALLARTTDKPARRALLAGKVEDMLNTVVRQIAFYSFEQKIHARRRQGELTADDISALWLEVQGESLGPSVRLNPGYEHYWLYISHFVHAPFYVYAYAFGDCLVNALYARYEAEPAGFGEKYLALLEAGGTKGHKELLAPFGLDASDPSFWSLGLDCIAAMIDELEAMG
jgi:oligoendopeptidase F